MYYKAIMKQIRSGVEIDKATPKELNSLEHVAQLRKLLQPDDLGTIKTLAEHGEMHSGRLAINLLNRSLWQNNNDKPLKQIITFLARVWNESPEY